MIVINCNQPTYWDVDDTLVMWGYNNGDKDAVEIVCDGYSQFLQPHKKHIEQLKAHRARGHTTIVWSQGGSEWASAVVRALNLESYVDLVIEKPQWLYDDSEPQAYMPQRKWLKDE